MRIVFVRHGEPDYEHDCLTDLGHKQAECAALRLREEGIETIFSSPMGRAQQTAAAASRVLGLPVLTLPGMEEITWGSMTDAPLFDNGHPWGMANELVRRGENLNNPDWKNHPFYATNKARGEVDKVALVTDEWLAGLGYVRKGLYYENVRPDDRQFTVALFSHGGSSTAVLSHILNIPFPCLCGLLHLPFTGITILRFDRSPHTTAMPCLELAGDGRHLSSLSDSVLVPHAYGLQLENTESSTKD